MKKFILILTLLAAGSVICFAQCDKKVMLTSTKTQHLDGSGTLQETIDEKVTVELVKTTITITHGEEAAQMTGPFTITSCNWTRPFKEGKTVLKATLTDNGGDEKHATITIEGKDGKIMLRFELDEMADRKIQITADKFEEKV